MLYKVTPMMAPPEAKPEKKPRVPGQPRKKRKSAVYDHEGHEVLISLSCLKCRQVKPLVQFGLRKMADGAIRNQPWCRTCRSGAGAPRPKNSEQAPVAAVEAAVLVAEAASAVTITLEPAPVPLAAIPMAAEPVAPFGAVEPAASAPSADEPLVAIGSEPAPAS